MLATVNIARLLLLYPHHSLTTAEEVAVWILSGHVITITIVGELLLQLYGQLLPLDGVLVQDQNIGTLPSHMAS